MTGKTCQNWQKIGNESTESDPGRGLGDHNYCRNPHDNAGSWCYVTDWQVGRAAFSWEWEYCACGMYQGRLRFNYYCANFFEFSGRDNVSPGVHNICRHIDEN